jgi:antitoxin VapB
MTAFLPLFLNWKIGRKMALNIKSRETERVVRELAKRTGLPITEAVRRAVVEKLQAIDVDKEARKRALREIIERGRRLPNLDPRTDDEILGYDERGTFD